MSDTDADAARAADREAGGAWVPPQGLPGQPPPPGYGQPAADPGPAAGPSIADQLNQLVELHNQGALTDEEFAAAKASVLGGSG